jgi:hypothetical protein
MADLAAPAGPQPQPQHYQQQQQQQQHGGAAGDDAAAAAAANGNNANSNTEPGAVCAEPKVFVGGLRYEVTQAEVEAHFSRYGALRSAALLKHLDTGKSKGCAMVLFESWGDAEAAIVAEHGAQSQLTAPRAAVVKFADPQRNDQGALCGVTPKKLFIGQVPADASAEQIRALCEPYGAISDVALMPPRKPGATTACAFVTFATWAQAEAALRAIDGHATLEGGGAQPLTAKFADAKPAELAKFDGRGTKRGAWEMGMFGGGGGMGMGGGGGMGMGDGGGGGPGGGKRQYGMGRGGMPTGPMDPSMMMNPMMMMVRARASSLSGGGGGGGVCFCCFGMVVFVCSIHLKRLGHSHNLHALTPNRSPS